MPAPWWRRHQLGVGGALLVAGLAAVAVNVMLETYLGVVPGLVGVWAALHVIRLAPRRIDLRERR